MQSNVLISLITATYGRYAELDRFLLSLTQQSISKQIFEVLIIDQNDSIDLCPLIRRYQEVLKIQHIRSKIRGLTYNRNIGLNLAHGNIVAFPDDDCWYLPDTLAVVLKAFDSTKADCIVGKVTDGAGSDIIRRWPNQASRVTVWNFFRRFSSIGIFSRCRILFDDKFGVGAPFGGWDDADYILTNIRGGKQVFFCPQVVVCHPPLSIHTMSHKKLYNYGLGFGGLCRKHRSLPIMMLLISNLAYHLTLLVAAVLRQNRSMAKARMLNLVSKINGFFTFPGDRKPLEPQTKTSYKRCGEPITIFSKET